MINLLSQQERFQDANELVITSLLIDPHNTALKKMKEITDARLKSSKAIPLLEQRFDTEPNNRPLLLKLLQEYAIIGNQKKIDQHVKSSIQASPRDASLLREFINFYALQNNIPKAMGITDINKIYEIEDLVKKDVIFAATGVTNGLLVNGVQKYYDKFTTETLLLSSAQKMSYKVKTTRY